MSQTEVRQVMKEAGCTTCNMPNCDSSTRHDTNTKTELKLTIDDDKKNSWSWKKDGNMYLRKSNPNKDILVLRRDWRNGFWIMVVVSFVS